MTKINLVEDRGLMTPTSFAKEVGVGRTYVYRLIEQDKIDWCEICGVKFVVITEKTSAYIPKTREVSYYQNGETNV